MCMINESVDEITDTKLFASFNNNKSRQLMIYSNQIVNFIANNAMILPVPHPDSVKFHSTELCTTLFDDLDVHFVKRFKPKGGHSLYRSNATLGMSDSSTLEIHNVGSYVVSIVPTINDFDRLDKSVFTLSSNIRSIVEHKYSATFGYLICKLKTGYNTVYEPLAYSHNTLTKNNKPYLFIPSYHHHPDPYSHSIMLANNTGLNVVDDWSHNVYIVNLNPAAQFNSYLNSLNPLNEWMFDYDPTSYKNLRAIKMIEKNVDFELPHQLHYFQKLHIEGGEHLNTDIVVETY